MPDPKCEILMKHGTAILIIVLGLSILVQAAAEAQQPGKVYRIGILGISTFGFETDAHQCPVKGNPNWQGTIAGLEDHGYIRGRNLALECRWTEGLAERGARLAVELADLKPDLLLAIGTLQVQAAKKATGSIPIVMSDVIDPVGRGLVASLARPGANVTGLTDTPAEMEGKRLQFLREIAPDVSRVAVMGPAETPAHTWIQRYLSPVSDSLGLSLECYEVKESRFEDTFAAMAAAGEKLLFVLPTPHWNTVDLTQKIAGLALQKRLPSIYQDRRHVEAGGLMAYHADVAIRRRVGVYVDKILKGANPGDLPVEQPTKFNLVINRRTATALGLTIPQSLLVMADEVLD